MSDEGNVWAKAMDAYYVNDRIEDGTAAAAVIRDYGDKRDATARSEGHAAGYQQAIADVVEWLGERARICDDWEWEEDWIEADACRKAASQITRLTETRAALKGQFNDARTNLATQSTVD